MRLFCTFSILFSLLCSTLSAQKSDSLRLRNAEVFRPSQLIAPAVLVGAGITGVTIPAVQKLDTKIDECFTYPKLKADNIVQYLPLVSVYGLKLSGVPSRHDYLESTVVIATSYAAMGIMVNGVKYTVKRRRPDSSARNSFPSGHTATVFMGAEILRTEYRDTSPWIGVAGYVVAAGVGVCRIYNHRHYMTDVLAGAGIGILSARIGYWMLPVWRRWLFPNRGGQSLASLSPYYDGRSAGAAFSMCF